MKKDQHYINVRGEVLPSGRQLLPPLNNLENGSVRNRENLQYKKTADSVLLSLFMRNNEKCNNSHVP